MNSWGAVISLLGLLGASGCGGSDTPAHTCLTDQQICQFTAGVSTTADVRKALGPPQISQSINSGGTGLQQWAYVCQQSAQNVDLVQFLFNGDGVLEGLTVQRSGPGASPAPSCG
jgi:hypothetical protein